MKPCTIVSSSQKRLGSRVMSKHINVTSTTQTSHVSFQLFTAAHYTYTKPPRILASSYELGSTTLGWVAMSRSQDHPLHGLSNSKSKPKSYCTRVRKLKIEAMIIVHTLQAAITTQIGPGMPFHDPYPIKSSFTVPCDVFQLSATPYLT
jgi:hypothetical protein